MSDPYNNLPVTPEEEEAWLSLAAKESLELKEREAKKPKSSLRANSRLSSSADEND